MQNYKILSSIKTLLNIITNMDLLIKWGFDGVHSCESIYICS